MEQFVRPDSEQLTDLHIYLVPPLLWRQHLQSAISGIIEETISAGFIRVHPEASIYSLRRELDVQLEYENTDFPIPAEYVFLKSVGRCLTQVKPRQEQTLKIKHFLPPQAYAAEIFILDAELAPNRTTPYSGTSSQSSSVRYNGTPRSDRSEFSGHKPIPPIGHDNQTNGGLSEEEQRKLDDLLRRQKEEQDRAAIQAETDRKQAEWEAEQEKLRKQQEAEQEAEQERLRRQEEAEQEQQRKKQETEKERKRRLQEEERRRKQAEEDQEQEEERRRREDEERRLEKERRKQDEENRLQREKEEEEERRRQEDEDDEAQRRQEAEQDDSLDASRGQGLTPGGRSLTELKRELEQLRQERVDAEHHREELVKKARHLQTRTQQRRNQARDAWKKKYFEEKKKTNPLEDQCNKLRNELEMLHRKIMSQLETSKDPASRRPGDNKPSQQNNLKIQATRLQHDIDDLQRRVENIKMKLTTEMKLRNQAQGELKALRAELTQKKINMTLTHKQPAQHPIAHLSQSPGVMLTPRS